MASRPRLQATSRWVARRLAVELLDRVARTAQRLVTQLSAPPYRPLPATAASSTPAPTPHRPPASFRAPAPAKDPGPAPASPVPRPVPAAGSAPPVDTAARIAAAPNVGWALVDILGRRLEPALASLAVDLEAAEDPRAALRELRIASRRLRAFTQVYADPIRDKRARALRKRLRKITRAAGEIRQWDAHIALVASIREPPDPLQRAALEHVTAWLHEKRETAAHAGGRRLEHHERKRLAADLSHHLDHVGGQLLRAGDDAAARVRPWLAAVLRPLACRLGPPVTEDDMERLHAVRIVAKRTRYLLELTRPAIEAEYRSVRRPAKRVQRTIGRYHDAALLQTLLTARRDELREGGFVTLAGALQPILDRLVLERSTACTAALPWTRAFGAQALRSFADALDPAEPATPATPPESPASPPDQSDDGLT